MGKKIKKILFGNRKSDGIRIYDSVYGKRSRN